MSVRICDVGPRNIEVDHRARWSALVLNERGFQPAAAPDIAEIHYEGIETEIDLGALIAVARWPEDRLGHPVPALLHSAGGFAGEVVA